MITKSHINFIWLIIEKTTTLFGVFFVSALVAKYIGPFILGQIALATTTFQIVQVAGVFGSDNILAKRVSLNPKSVKRLIKPLIIMRTSVYLLLTCPALFYFWCNMDQVGFFLAISTCMSFYFNTIDIFTVYNDSILRSKINALANLAGLLCALLVRFFIVENNLSPASLGIPIILIGLIPFSIKATIYRTQHQKKDEQINTGTKKHLKYLVSTGMSLLIPTLSVAIYPRIGLLMVSYFYGSAALGIYSVSQTLATSWSFILISLVTSYMPTIYGERNKSRAIHDAGLLHLRIAFLSILLITGALLSFGYIITELYGIEYNSAITPCLILCLSVPLSVMGGVSSRFIMKFSGYRYLTIKTIIVLIINALLSFILITRYGLNGAAIAVVITELLSLTILNYFFMKNIIFYVHVKAIKCLSIKKT